MKYLHKYLVILLLFSSNIALHAQGWIKAYDNYHTHQAIEH